MPTHANKRWPTAISTALWPYAIRMANDVVNATPNMNVKGRLSPEQVFADTKVNTNPKHWHPFGCPVYVLESELQSNKPFDKWKDRSKVGIYIGRSPIHAKSVALVLSRDTGLVSPQFHVRFDDSFQTVMQDKLDSIWQLKAGFVAQREDKP